MSKSYLLSAAVLLSALSVVPSSAQQRRETVQDGDAWAAKVSSQVCKSNNPADEAECSRIYASIPMCVDYKNYGQIWYDMVENPIPHVDTMANQTDVINHLGDKPSSSTPPFYSSPQYRDLLQRLLRVALSADRRKFSGPAQFADFAYKSCLGGRPL
ncbi:hypothetical protein QA639_21740 [Bradyrhizobium pachyrhizi]|uniref:hypothetical protein n=1 Tax=Bradyrhizobium pachyrhizi TaxID=280333 RepID=UPI0024B08B6C|nr:hypothetical protein [Bradyrhizobium pachyrhizi]WFU52332.1 hypothetical protein QA639_21740 [Bradyrhizobium pachyrhizi]